jgi:FdhD protein
MGQSSVSNVQRLKIEGDLVSESPDLLVVEEPMEIRLHFGPEAERKHESISVTMRTPGHDFELALGFLFTEGVISDYKQVKNIRYCEEVESPEEEGNVVIVALNTDVEFELSKLERHFYTASSCGVCGKTSIDAVTNAGCSVIETGISVSKQVLTKFSTIVGEQQTVFKHTGGIHAAALFTNEGELLVLREDVGRHNAVDKVIGAQLIAGSTPLSNRVMWVSGRAGFELVQKSLMAGIPIMTAVGAPSSLAVELAEKHNMTLAGFLSGNRCNIYTGKQRILTS